MTMVNEKIIQEQVLISIISVNFSNIITQQYKIICYKLLINGRGKRTLTIKLNKITQRKETLT